MLRIVESKGADRAKSYFTEGLSRGDYYAEGQEIAGRWGGKGAPMLSLSGDVTRDAFAALCDNMRPDTGERLTGRTNDGRRVGYDFNFHVPKSVSAVFELTGDARILSAFRDAVRDTMTELEADMQARVRKGKKDENRVTGNILYAEFIHRTARPVDGGLPDPHLHAHCFVFNATYDATEKQWKAGEFGDIKRDAPYFEAGFHARLAGKVAALGYGIERTTKGWEIAGVPHSVIEKFSNRTAEIEAEAKRRGITDVKVKDQLGAKTRSRKRKDVGMEELRREWAGRLTADEWRAIQMAGSGGGGVSSNRDAQAMDYAMAHSFERRSVVSDRQLQTTALRYGVGAVTVEGVKREADRKGVLKRYVNGQRLATTREVLDEEKKIIEWVKIGRWAFSRLGKKDFVFEPGRLNDEQKAAVLHVLRSRDQHIGIRGGAGVGKTTLMREAVRGIEEGGKQVFVFAPTADASRGVLRAEGFKDADTVAALLTNERWKEKIAGQVIWIDEAGTLGARQMQRVLRLANACYARVVTSGDIRQHTAVERGDALRLLEDKAGLKTVEVREIQRQKGDYKKAVAAISKGNLGEGFRQLENLNAVVELPEDKRYTALAAEYADAVKHGKTVLAVSPTKAEGAKATDAIRAAMRDTKTGKKPKPLLEHTERVFTRLENLQLTEAQRGDARQYREGWVVQFTQKTKGFERGERVGVIRAGMNVVEVVNGQGRNVILPLDKAARFQVYRQDNIALAVGEKIRITQNGFSVPDTGKGKGHRLDNGALFNVAAFTKAGDIQLNNGWVVRRDFGHVQYGYCSTSHSAQGKTVDRVLIAQSAASTPAASREQFYVSVSRGRESVRIFTDDRQALRDAVTGTSARMSAMELTEKGSVKPRRASQVRRHTELLRQLRSHARVHAARAVSAAKEAARQVSGPQTWAQRVRPGREREMEMG